MVDLVYKKESKGIVEITISIIDSIIKDYIKRVFNLFDKINNFVLKMVMDEVDIGNAVEDKNYIENRLIVSIKHDLSDNKEDK